MKENDEKELGKNAFLKKAYYLKYFKKFKQFNISKDLAESLIDEPNGVGIIKIIDKSATKDEFAKYIQKYLKLRGASPYSESLLLGNLTGNYTLYCRSTKRLDGLNLNAFSKENTDLLQDLRAHFVEYILNNNSRKNAFAKLDNMGSSISLKNLSKGFRKKDLLKYFDTVLDGNNNPKDFDSKAIFVFLDYVVKTIGTYSREDIENNFDFVLYDLDNAKDQSLDERRERFASLRGLSTSQIKKIDQVDLLKQRLSRMGIYTDNYKALELLKRLCDIDYDYKGNIDELEDIYLDYEVLYRQELVDNLSVPEKDITIVKDFKEIRPQLLHQFIRDIDSFKEEEYENIKQRIIAERTDNNRSKELSKEEYAKFLMLKERADVNFDRYKVNYSMPSIKAVYSDANGLERYFSNTSNQISAQYFPHETFINSETGIKGIGFNKESLSPEAIAISSRSYKTTNKGLNNVEYDEQKEFDELSAPTSELDNASRSEVVLHRRGLDYDTKASYVFAVIDSSRKKDTKKIMDEIKEIRDKEGLKALVYDKNFIRQSLEHIMVRRGYSKDDLDTDYEIDVPTYDIDVPTVNVYTSCLYKKKPSATNRMIQEDDFEQER